MLDSETHRKNNFSSREYGTLRVVCRDRSLLRSRYVNSPLDMFRMEIFFKMEAIISKNLLSLLKKCLNYSGILIAYITEIIMKLSFLGDVHVHVHIVDEMIFILQFKIQT